MSHSYICTLRKRTKYCRNTLHSSFQIVNIATRVTRLTSGITSYHAGLVSKFSVTQFTVINPKLIQSPLTSFFHTYASPFTNCLLLKQLLPAT